MFWGRGRACMCMTCATLEIVEEGGGGDGRGEAVSLSTRAGLLLAENEEISALQTRRVVKCRGAVVEEKRTRW